MTADQVIGLMLALLVMFLGLAGSVLPGLPGTPLILIAAIGHKLYFGHSGVSWAVLVVLVLLTVASIAVDYLASWVGAKRLGATWRGALGAVLGGLIGLFFSLPGMLLGPFVGAVVFEIAGGRELRDAGRAGLGAVLGLLAGALGKLAFGIAMIGVFAGDVLYRGLHHLPASELQACVRLLVD